VYSPTPFEVVFSLEGDQGHPRKGIGRTVDTWLLENDHETARTEFYVLTHGARVHAKKAKGDGVTYELVFDVDSVTDDRADVTRTCGADKSVVEKASKIAMQAFVTANQFI
jgi:hypothetical protein